MNRFLKVLCCLVVFPSVSLPAFADHFDLVIKNGRVMDPETGYDAVANVGINNGFITKITPDNIRGTHTIDANGHVVAPGFIDYHCHGQEPFAFRLYARDGVTTAMDLEMGAFPIDAFYAYWEEKALINYGSTVSQQQLFKANERGTVWLQK